MLNFDSLSLKALVVELKPLLTSGRVSKVQQPSKHELLLTIRAGGKNRKLYICVDPKYPHLAVLSKDGEKLRHIEIPKVPPMFCMLLRKHMEGCKINDIRQPGFDRIFEIYFDSYSEIGAKVPMVLSCEFMGKYSNIVLYNYETNMILGCAHTVSSEKSRERELAGGLPFIYPPKQDKIDINQISEQDFLNFFKISPSNIDIRLNEKFGYISKALARELCDFCNIETAEDKVTAIQPDKLKCLYNITQKTINLENLNPSISSDMSIYSPVGLDKSIEWQNLESINSMLDKYFGLQVFENKFNQLKNKLSRVTKKEIKSQNTLLAKHEKTMQSTEKQENYRQIADLIMANLYKIKQGQDCVKLENIYKDNELIEIQLDPMLSANDNAQKYYKLYNKTKTAAKHSEKLHKKISNEIQYLESVQGSINQAETIPDLMQIKQELVDQDYMKAAKKEPKSKKLPKEVIELAEFTSSDGYTILAGKNNKQNEFILKNSSPEDIWLHVQDIPGSHVIIKTPKDEKIPETTIHEAVYIAAYYSSAKESSNVPVVYTKRKFVKKPSGAKPGFVIYAHEKTLWVNPEQEKVLALKKHG